MSKTQTISSQPNSNLDAVSDASAHRGHIHPLSQVIAACVGIFNDMGFEYAEGPEIETEYYNFDALNIPKHHPARDMWDTFWLKPENSGKLLRTHTSPVQIRELEKVKTGTKELPIRIIAPGKVFRHEATDATHEAQFYQIEGMAIGTDITLATMKGVLTTFFEKFFGTAADIRLRPSFFPFVEPGVEIDVSCFACKGKNPSCSVCKGTGWIEIMGAGMVHPKVLAGVGIDPRVYRGFAFGCGIDRLAMLKFGIDDVRLLYSGDLRLTNQF